MMNYIQKVGVPEFLLGATLGAYIVYSVAYFSCTSTPLRNDSTFLVETRMEDKVIVGFDWSFGKNSLEYLCDETVCPLSFQPK